MEILTAQEVGWQSYESANDKCTQLAKQSENPIPRRQDSYVCAFPQERC